MTKRGILGIVIMTVAVGMIVHEYNTQKAIAEAKFVEYRKEQNIEYVRAKEICDLYKGLQKDRCDFDAISKHFNLLYMKAKELGL